MRSSSSELLLDEQEELRKRKIKELALAKKQQTTKQQGNRSCREQALFYSTSFLAIIALAAGSSLLFLVPLYVDPAISTIASDFVTEPVTCITTRKDELLGLNNCSWSSCREGCTSDAYHSIKVCAWLRLDNNWSKTSPSTKSTIAQNGVNYMDDDKTVRHEGKTDDRTDDAVLLVNIKGCGYPPTIKCENFTDVYGQEGTVFPCYPSRENRTVVLTHYLRDEQVAIIIHYFAVPFVITLTTSIALCVMHCDCTCRPAMSGRRARASRLHRPSYAGHRAPLRSEFSDGSLSLGFQPALS